MFRTTYLTFVFLCFVFALKAQNFTDEIPNYFLAKNSNFTVTFITTPPLGTTTSYSGGFSGVISHTKLSKLDPSEFDNVNEGMYNEVFRLLQERFDKLSLAPSFYMVMPYSDFGNPQKLKEYGEKTNSAKPGFSLRVMLPNTLPKAEKAYRKGNLTLEHIKPVSISVAKTYANEEEAKGKSVYALNKMNMNLEKGLTLIEESIKEKGSSYFVETMDIPMEAFENEVDVSYLEKYQTVKEEIASFPEEEELSNSTLLVITLDSESDGKIHDYAKKMMDKYYPHQYKLVSLADYHKHINNYKYVLLAQGDMYEKNKTSQGNNGFNKVKTSVVSRNYYFVKDVEALKAYYGMPLDALKKKASESPYTIVEQVLKRMKKHYNWE